jgi:CheY-like chemotaxis protein
MMTLLKSLRSNESNLAESARGSGVTSSDYSEPGARDFLLIAEDNLADVRLLRLALEEYGIPIGVHVVRDGEAVLRFIERVEEDPLARCAALAIVDLNLPRYGGDEILRRLRASEKWRHVPVIVASSSVAASDRAEAMRLGAAAYFVKPSDLEQFLRIGALIRDILSKRVSNAAHAVALHVHLPITQPVFEEQTT